MQLGRARPHPAWRFAGDAADQRVPVGRLPRQLDRRPRRRHVRRLDAQHLGRIQGQHQHGRDRMDPRRPALELQARPGRRLPVAARRRGVRRLSLLTLFDDHCCQITGGGTYVKPTAPSRGLVLKLDPARTPRPRRRVQPRHELRRRVHGQHRAARERQRVRRLGIGAVLHRVRRVRQHAARRAPAGARPQLPSGARAVGRPAAIPARGRRPPDASGRTTVYASWNGATDVASWRVVAGDGRHPDNGGERAPVGVRDRDPGRRVVQDVQGPGARSRRPRARDLERVRNRQVARAAGPIPS